MLTIIQESQKVQKKNRIQIIMKKEIHKLNNKKEKNHMKIIKHSRISVSIYTSIYKQKHFFI